MKKYYHNIIIIFIFSILFFCQSCSKEKGGINIAPNYKGSVRVINIDDDDDDEVCKVLKLDTLIDVNTVKFIQLETNSKSIFGYSSRLYTTDSSYLVVDEEFHLILEFTKEGKFIKTIGDFGRGPNEFLDIIDVRYNKYSNSIDVYDRSLKLIKYNVTTGKPIGRSSKILSKNFFTHFFMPIDTDSYVLYNHFVDYGENEKQYRFGYLKDGHLTYKSLPYKHHKNISEPALIHSSFYSYQDSIRFFERFIPIVYNVTKNGLYPKYKFIFKSQSGIEININDPLSDLQKKETRNKIAFLNRVVETKNYLFIAYTVFGDRARIYSIYDLSANKCLGVSFSFTGFYIEDIRTTVYLKPSNEDEFLITSLDPLEIIEAQKTIIKEKRIKYSPMAEKFMQLNVNEDDNEILMLFKVK